MDNEESMKSLKKDILEIKNDISLINENVAAILSHLLDSSDIYADKIDGLEGKTKDLDELQKKFKEAKINLSALTDFLKGPM